LNIEILNSDIEWWEPNEQQLTVSSSMARDIINIRAGGGHVLSSP